MIVPKSGSFPSSACSADKLPICTITTSTCLPCLAMSIATFNRVVVVVIVVVVKVVVEIVLVVYGISSNSSSNNNSKINSISI